MAVRPSNIKSSNIDVYSVPWLEDGHRFLDKPLKTSNMETKDKELIKQLTKQIALGSAMAAAFLVMVYLGGLAAHLISGTY